MGSMATANGAKDRCPRQHPYDGRNLYVNPAGKRECRACHAAAQQRYRDRLKSSAVGGP